MAQSKPDIIDQVLAEVRDLPDLSSRWDELDEDQRFAISYDWDAVVMWDLLRAIERHHQADKLTNEQEERYVELKAELKAALPIIERLGLRSPSEVLGTG